MRGLILLIAFSTSLFSENCDCKKIFGWTKKTFEENDAGFSYILERKGTTSYKVHNELFFAKIDTIRNPIVCEGIILEWLHYFRKSHIEFHYTKRSAQPEKKIEDDGRAPIVASQDKLFLKFLNARMPFIEAIDSNTTYLRIPSFTADQKSNIDSVIYTNRSRILSRQNLIIDIRNGTGGSDKSFESILPLLYTNPIRMPAVEFLSTPLNNKRMYEIATNTGIASTWGLSLTEGEKREFMARFDTLNKHYGEFVNLDSSNINVIKLDTIYNLPENIGIIVNESNVSSDEQFLLQARQSKKVKIFGRPTRGGVDISNLFLTYSPDKSFVLVYALSRSLRLPDMVIDDIGILPDFFLDSNMPEEEWIRYVSLILSE